MNAAQEKTITINGYSYVIVDETPFEYKGKQRIALKIRKPKGKVIYRVVVYENGTISSVV